MVALFRVSVKLGEVQSVPYYSRGNWDLTPLFVHSTHTQKENVSDPFNSRLIIYKGAASSQILSYSSSLAETTSGDSAVMYVGFAWAACANELPIAQQA